MKRLLLLLSLLPGLASADTAASAARMLENIRVLASDEFEGRAPGSRGEELTVAYLEKEARAIGLQPGCPDGSFIQEVPMVGIITRTRSSWSAGGKSGVWAANIDVVAPSLRSSASLSLKDSEVVFLGYGVTAPEYGWDDYKGIDVRGKTVVVLIGDPAVPLKDDPSRLDPRQFSGEAMTYYGRWTYKYENAAAHGAAACLIVHETGPAAYPFSVVVDSRSRENFKLDVTEAEGLPLVEGWLSLDAARSLLATAGRDFDTLKREALLDSRRPVSLDARVSFEIENKVRHVRSRNVAAVLPGSDPVLRNEYIILSAHWDHLGKAETDQGVQIYHGALDNAAGVAQILEVARMLASKAPGSRPARSVHCLFTTAEEKYLLGAAHYIRHPLVPLEKTLADINVDMPNPYSATDDISIVGWGYNTLEDLAREVASGQGRVLTGDPNPSYGSYYRADHFEFARAGIPCLYPRSGSKFRDRPADFASTVVKDFVKNHYHKASDVIRPEWTMEGTVLDAEFIALLTEKISASKDWPRWYPGCEFQDRRQRSKGTL